LAIEALRGQAITDLASHHQVSRQFIYRQVQRADAALEQAFTPAPAAAEQPLFWLPVTKPWLQQLVLGLVLIGHSSLRGVQELLADLFDFPVSLGTIQHIVQQAVPQARAANAAPDLGRVRAGALDEIFQTGQPVLVGVDVDSTYCYLLSPEQQRDTQTWGVRLLELADRHLQPEFFIADFGTGLRAGQALAWPTIPCRGDVFHALRDGPQVLTTLENRAYQALAALERCHQKIVCCRKHYGRSSGPLHAQRARLQGQANQALALLDDVTVLLRWLREDVLALHALPYADRVVLYDFIVEELLRHAPRGPQRLGQLAKLLRHHQADLLAFAGA
jgi:hypothetical protein